MRHSTGTPTKAEAARFAKLQDLGCIACWLNGSEWSTIPQIHHYLRGNKRIGHSATVPLCCWHHTGISADGLRESEMLRLLGPSFHRHTRAFRERYGDDAILLARVNQLIGEV